MHRLANEINGFVDSRRQPEVCVRATVARKSVPQGRVVCQRCANPMRAIKNPELRSSGVCESKKRLVKRVTGAAKNILQGHWQLKGVHLPTLPSIYEPILQELETLGLCFSEIELTL